MRGSKLAPFLGVRLLLAASLVLLSCQPVTAPHGGDSGSRPGSSVTVTSAPRVSAPADEDLDAARKYREELIRELSVEVQDERVLDAMRRVPRHLFIPGASLERAYEDAPVPIGFGQTISQPTVVAIMTEALELRGTERVLEIGTGSGYQAAILSLLANDVYTIELVPELAEESRARLSRLGYANVHVLAGDGYKGWPEHAPFDRIIVTAAPEELPKALADQLGEGGILVAPVGASGWSQRLFRYRKSRGRLSTEDLGGVRFVPMVPGD